MTNLEQYADQCAAERLARQITKDILELEEFEDDMEDIAFIIASGAA